MTHTDLQATTPGTALIRPPQRDIIVLDGSSSMQANWWEMMDAIQTYADTLTKNRVESLFTLTVFSDWQHLDLEHYHGPVAELPHLFHNPAVSTWGMTPLYDAINCACWRLRDEDPLRACLTVVTDGDNNDSRFTDEVQCKQMLDWVRAKGWEVVFIGCDWNNDHLASLLGGSPQSYIGVAKAQLTDAARELAMKRTRYAATGAPMHWTEDERKSFGGYLAAPDSPR